MRLSEAMRLGAMLKPQAFGELWTCAGRRSCALGAAFDGIGHTDRYSMPLLFAAVLCGNVCCPACGFPWSVAATITHLNDHHHWTREQIADWVETIERVESPASTYAVDPSAADPGTPTPRAPDFVSS